MAGYFASNVRVRARSSDPASLTIDEARALIASRKLSPAEITRAYLARIEQINPRLNAYITVTAASALKQRRGARGGDREGEHTRSRCPASRTQRAASRKLAPADVVI